jgi:hypothetical protein
VAAHAIALVCFAVDCRHRRSVELTGWGMQHASLALMIAIMGCATTTAVGAQAIGTPHGGGSVEATLGGGVGLGTEDDATLLRADGALGTAADGGVQGRLQLSNEWVSFGMKAGWQLRGGMGGSFGAYQSPDLTVQVSGGPHWNLQRTELPSAVRTTSVALDATIGYGFRGGEAGRTSRSLGLDGPFVGLGLSLRRDHVSDLDFKYWPRSTRAAAHTRLLNGVATRCAARHGATSNAGETGGGAATSWCE